MGDQLIPEAGNGLMGRRAFMTATASTAATLLSASAAGAQRTPWMRAPGAPMSESGVPSRHEAGLQRVLFASAPGTTGAGTSATPHEHLDGIITPSRLHFERHHAGIPDIDPDRHRLMLHGLVQRPLSFSVDALHRYPIVSRIQFLECSGNSAMMTAPEPPRLECGQLHGLLSSSEWGGVPLSILLDEAGLMPQGRWVVADGADAAVLARSIPLEKMMDDAIVALYQNGEPLRPANGYPLRLFLPGWEGNASVKWLRSLRVTDQPAMTKDETSKYSDLRADGSAEMFTFEMGVKSVITTPSPGLILDQPGLYQISGLAWSGAGRVQSVAVSADGGRTWADAQLDAHVLSRSVTRFRTAWQWNGSPATLLSRATDESGSVQPSREVVMRDRPPGSYYHYNAIQAWQVSDSGEVSNVYV
ncbi:MAG: sulfite dehydrogenase [Pseudomonadales bacterium]|jgi:sulfane dehydrogenase subunit SoxC|nr:sulfite dehydrogenase [Pseudomonadales bacterium]MDP6469688.1 sulfite dehydrogenase [Pseudomonadales bacterium]MDP6828929.1 sulfite dehydrogenase [Pseudomonadales bacterium]MDP6972729.1 sulfite dehydrogenase [Pseudomonadales bacterium]|tara:strand:+ start:651 stop:1901 length:1251 start_codon:yes stop_codon:yes gene_type:complete